MKSRFYAGYAGCRYNKSRPGLNRSFNCDLAKFEKVVVSSTMTLSTIFFALFPGQEPLPLLILISMITTLWADFGFDTCLPFSTSPLDILEHPLFVLGERLRLLAKQQRDLAVIDQ